MNGKSTVSIALIRILFHIRARQTNSYKGQKLTLTPGNILNSRNIYWQKQQQDQIHTS